jgi:hypothetical protein
LRLMAKIEDSKDQTNGWCRVVCVALQATRYCFVRYRGAFFVQQM